MIFSLISNRLKEMRTVTELLDSAGRIARENGCTSPGSEKCVLKQRFDPRIHLSRAPQRCCKSPAFPRY